MKSRGDKPIRIEKTTQVAEIRERLAGSKFLFLIEHRGLNAATAGELRRRLRQVGGRYQVVPNRLLAKAEEQAGATHLAAKLTGPTAIVVGTGDAVETARALADFMKEHGGAPGVRSGVLEGHVLGAPDILALARLPARPVLQAIVIGTMAAPMRNLAGVLHQKAASILYVLKAVQAKKEQSAAA